MTSKAEVIFRSIVIVLFAVFLMILHQYAENGRYVYSEGGDRTTLSYGQVMDTRTEVVFGSMATSLSGTKFYKIDYNAQKIWFFSGQEIDLRKMPEENA
jgi:hypothetical protein